MSVLLGTGGWGGERRAGFSGWATKAGGVDWTNDGAIPAPSMLSKTVDIHAALSRPAVWGCVNLTATIAEILPLDVYSGDGRDKRPRRAPGWLLDVGGEGHGTGDWLYQAVFSAMLRGNDIGRVLERDPRTAQPRQISLAHPDHVRVNPGPDGLPLWSFGLADVPRDQIWHRRVYPVPGYVLGLSPITMHAQTLGVAIAAADFGHRWFTDGAHPSALLSSEQELTPAQATDAKTRFLAALRGKREPLVLGKGLTYSAISLSPDDSQFLETQGYTAAEACRIFGPGYAEVYGYEVGGNLTYSTLEQASLHLLTYAVDPWLVRFERWLSALLPQPQFVKFNRDALTRTDLLTRYRAHEIALRNDFKVINEVRELEDLSPVAWGDEPQASPTMPSPIPADPAPTGGTSNA